MAQQTTTRIGGHPRAGRTQHQLAAGLDDAAEAP
jgi:hypothetical protein